MYNSIVFSIFTELCSHHRNVILEHFHHTLLSTPQKTPHTHEQPLGGDIFNRSWVSCVILPGLDFTDS